MEKKKSLVSIIVPAYNAEKFIDKCIRSVLNQSYPNLELILVDDGSTDETGKICEEYASKDTRVRVIHKKNSGVSAARNMGLSSAIGEYVVFLDSDDWLDEDIVELALKKYQKNCINIWGFVCYWPRNVLKTEELRAEGLCQEELIANAILHAQLPTMTSAIIFAQDGAKSMNGQLLKKTVWHFRKSCLLVKMLCFL